MLHGDVVDLCDSDDDNHNDDNHEDDNDQNDDILNDSDDEDYIDDTERDKNRNPIADRLLLSDSEDDDDYICPTQGLNYNLRNRITTTRGVTNPCCSKDVEYLGTQRFPSTVVVKKSTRPMLEYQRVRPDLYIRQTKTTKTTSNHSITNTKPLSTNMASGNNFIRTNNDTTPTTSTSSSSSSISIHRNDLCGGSGVGMSGYSWIQSNTNNNFKSIPSHSPKPQGPSKDTRIRQTKVTKQKTRKPTTRKKTTRVTSSLKSQSSNPMDNYETNMTTIPSTLHKTTSTVSSFPSRNRNQGTFPPPKKQQRQTRNFQHTLNNTIYNSVQRKDTELQHVGGASIAF